MSDPVASDPAFRRIAIIGLGLIGGSIAAGAKKHGLATHIVAWDQNEHNLNLGHDLGLIDEKATDIGAAARDADLVILAVPVQSMREVLSAIDLKDQILTDVGSVKAPVIQAAVDVFGRLPAKFVPGHPIAGSEKHGVVSANPDLFRSYRVILTPEENTDSEALSRVEKLWRALGANVSSMSAAHHDSVLAQTSHLPHLLAYALVDTLSGGGDSMEVFQYAAGGFRDFSRIAASDPTMWRDVFAANKAPVLEVLDRYVDDLGALRAMIESGRFEELKSVFERAKAARDHFSTIQPGGKADV